MQVVYDHFVPNQLYRLRGVQNRSTRRGRSRGARSVSLQAGVRERIGVNESRERQQRLSEQPPLRLR